jgi:biopolymer transport protein ExbB/TolQ
MQRQLRRAAGDAAAAGRLGRQLGGHLPQAARAQGVRVLNDGFERSFWSGTSLNELFAAAAQNAKSAGPMERIFASGMREYQKLRERRITTPAPCWTAPAAPCARASSARWTCRVNLSFLASVGSVSPYVGLFGTVWGIMHAFTGLAKLQQVTLATVAPGIAEALVATAIGLFAAIPAVIAYNRFARDIDRWPSSWRPSSRSSPTSCSATWACTRRPPPPHRIGHGD